MAAPRKHAKPAAPRQTLAEQLRLKLADDIVAGRLAPGVRLDETALAQRFQVSRTPVREALRLLAASGLAESRPHRGVIVTQITPEHLQEMFEVMAELEATCARIAARAMTLEDRRNLEAVHRDCLTIVRTGDPQAYHEANQRFHNAIYDGTHNAFLAETTLSVRARVTPFRRAQFRSLGRLAKSYEEHDAVVEAILRGDEEGASQAMRDHIGIVNVAFESYLADQLDVAVATR
jgi:DNA-binding GntR family transcriptional regulator